MDNVLVIYHKACSDGFCAAWVVRKIYPQAMFHAAGYGDLEEPDVIDKNVIIVDFSYKRQVLLEMYKKAKSLIVIDHHKTALEDLKGLEFCIFNMDKSGGKLTWDYFFKDESPWLVKYTEDRDLWRWQLPNSREINANLSSHQLDFNVWDDLEKMDITSDWFIKQGEAILRYQEQQLNSIISHAREVTLDGHKVLAANTSVLFSDVAGRLAKNRPFGIAWYMSENGNYGYSLRSDENGIDVAKVAEKYGGGGHVRASGFGSKDLIF